jgi:hypothetical protein
MNNTFTSYFIKRKIFLLLFFQLVLGALLMKSKAATRVWTGTTSTDWNTASNWSPASVPGSGDVANIPGGLSIYPTVNGTYNVGTININTASSGATLTITTGASLTASGLLTINVNGSLVQTGGTSKFNGIAIDGSLSLSSGLILSTGTINVNSGGTLTESGGTIYAATNTSANPTDNLVINAGGSVTQTGGSIEVKDFQLLTNTTATFTQNESTGTSLVKIDHDYKNTGGVLMSTAGTFNWTGVSSAGGGAEYDLGTNQFFNVVFDGSNNPGLTNDPNGNLLIRGNWTNNNSALDLISSATNVTFNGSGTQVIGGTQSTTFDNLTINKTANTVQLNISVVVNSLLTLTGGLIETSASNLITVDANGSTSGASNNSYVSGPCKKINITTSFTFPTGKNGSLRACILAGATVATDAFTAEYFRAMPNDTSQRPIGVSRISSVEYWNIARTGTGNVNITLTWDAASYVSVTSDISIVRWSGAAWVNLGGTPAGSSSTGSTTVTGVNTFNNFTFGSSTFINALPVKWVSFDVKPTDNNVLLTWVTATERNCDRFEIESGADGLNFTGVGIVAGKGNSNNLTTYNFIDTDRLNKGYTNLFYRLKQVDGNGEFEYSRIVKVSSSPMHSIDVQTLYPNPFKNNMMVGFTIPHSARVIVSITDAMGRVLGSQETEAKHGLNEIEMNTEAYSKGIYFLTVTYNGVNSPCKVITKE